MDSLLSQFLVQHRQLLLPGLGALDVSPEPARYDGVNQQFIPNRLSLKWSQAVDVAGSVQPLIGYMSQQSGQTEESCFDELLEYCEGIKNKISDAGEWVLPGLGKLVNAPGGNIGFEPDASLSAYVAPIEVQRIAHTGRSHQLVVGDRETNTAAMQQLLHDENNGVNLKGGKWWIASAIIGSAAILLMLARLVKLV